MMMIDVDWEWIYHWIEIVHLSSPLFAYFGVNENDNKDDEIEDDSKEADDSTWVASNQGINLCCIHIHDTVELLNATDTKCQTNRSLHLFLVYLWEERLQSISSGQRSYSCCKCTGMSHHCQEWQRAPSWPPGGQAPAPVESRGHPGWREADPPWPGLRARGQAQCALASRCRVRRL